MFDLAPRDRPGEDLRIPSRHTPTGADQRRLRREVDYNLALEQGRLEIQTRRIINVAEAGRVALTLTSLLTRAAENEAERLPDERQRGDAIVDVVAACHLRLLSELGG